MENLEEYIITLKSMDDLDAFYDDMETPGGNLYIPNRAVTVYLKRPTSRNTHYMLTADEAKLIEGDSRVIGVILAAKLAKSIELFSWTTPTQRFAKGIDTAGDTMYNWGLYRSIHGSQIADWGSDITGDVYASATCGLSGKNVDVLILDGHINADHPSFSVNSDGTGGSRVNQIDWFSLNSIVLGDQAGFPSDLYSYTYSYTPYIYNNDYSHSITSNNGHGTHVAGVVAGNENGFARDANIYNLYAVNDNPNSNAMGILFTMWDYVRAFHNTKPINPATGFKNPTICNCSFGATQTFPDLANGYGPITRVNHRGTIIGDGVNPLTSEELTTAGIYNVMGMAKIPYYATAWDADVEQAIQDGIIIVAAAGNNSAIMDKVGGLDYNNTIYYKFGIYDYTSWSHRGHYPANCNNVVAVGSVGSTNNDSKATYSNTGPIISLFAPGTNIFSSYVYYLSGASAIIPSPRNSSYGNARLSGTSMACPQVCGVLACALELYPNMTQIEALEYITHYAKPNQITATSGGITDLTDLQGAPNLYLYVYPERPFTDKVYPKVNFKPRQVSGHVYPRVKRRVYVLI